MNERERKGAEDRKFIRVKYNIPVIVETSDMAITDFEGYLQDISAQGVMFDSKEKLYSGLLVRLQLKMKKDLAPLVGNVQWCRKAPEGENYKVGLKLDDSLAEQNDRVIDMITDEIIDETKKNKE